MATATLPAPSATAGSADSGPALGAVRVLGAGEVFVRGEQYTSSRVTDRYLTAGLSYSPSAALGGPYQRARLTLAYQLRDGDAVPDAHLVILQGQIAF